MRLFFALLPDAPTQERLLKSVAQLNLAGHARAVASANLHITLAFVGEVPAPDLHLFREMGAAWGLPRCVIELDLIEYWQKSRAVVLAAQKNPHGFAAQTDQLRAAVAAQIQSRNDERPWRAHATLARKVAQAPVLTQMSPLAWASHSFCLMSSKTDGSDSVYTVVDSWPLLDKR